VASAYVNYALSNMGLGRYDTARVALRQAIAIRPQSLQYHLYLARCFGQLDSLTTAGRTEYEIVVKLADTSVVRYKAELAEAYKYIGVAFWLDKKFPPALESLEKSLSFKSDDAFTHLWKARSLSQMLKIDDAIKEYRVVLKLEPKNKEAKKELDDLLARQGQ